MNKFLAMHPKRPIYGMLGARLPEAYELTVKGSQAPAFVLGPYLTACGGLDTVQPYPNILKLMAKYVDEGHIIFEGLMASGVYGRIGEWMEPYGKRVHNLFLDTSFEVCLKRVLSRRDRGGDWVNIFGKMVEGDPFDPVNVKKKYDAVGYVLKRIKKDKLFHWQHVSSDEAVTVMTQLIQGKRP
jgi:hypothetical protein